MSEEDVLTLRAVWSALGAVTGSVPKELLASYSRCLREAMATAREKQRRKRKAGELLVPGMCLSKALGPVLPIYLQVRSLPPPLMMCMLFPTSRAVSKALGPVQLIPLLVISLPLRLDIRIAHGQSSCVNAAGCWSRGLFVMSLLGVFAGEFVDKTCWHRLSATMRSLVVSVSSVHLAFLDGLQGADCNFNKVQTDKPPCMLHPELEATIFGLQRYL